MGNEHISKLYTTNLNEIIEVHCNQMILQQ